MPARQQIERFWDFSIRTYRTSGVPDACLSLQNDYGADVNMLLYCCWVGTYVGEFDDQLFARANDFSATWAGQVVAPLRSARTWMKHTGCGMGPVPTESCMLLRDDIKSVEFAAEKLQQEVLQSLLSSDDGGDAVPDQVLHDVVANLNRYAESVGLDLCDDSKQKFSVIIAAAMPRQTSV